MQIEGERGGVFRGSNRTGGDKDGEGESKRSLGVADTEICQRRSEVLEAGQLLLPVHKRICNGGKALT